MTPLDVTGKIGDHIHPQYLRNYHGTKCKKKLIMPHLLQMTLMGLKWPVKTWLSFLISTLASYMTVLSNSSSSPANKTIRYTCRRENIREYYFSFNYIQNL